MGNFYANGIKRAFQGEMNWQNGGDTFLMALVTDGYIADFDNDDLVSAIGTNRADSGGSDIGDKTLTPSAPSIDTANNRVHLDSGGDPFTYSNVDGSQTIPGVVVYKEVVSGDDAQNLLLMKLDFASSISLGSQADVQVTFATDGLGRFTY